LVLGLSYEFIQSSSIKVQSAHHVPEPRGLPRNQTRVAVFVGDLLLDFLCIDVHWSGLVH